MGVRVVWVLVTMSMTMCKRVRVRVCVWVVVVMVVVEVVLRIVRRRPVDHHPLRCKWVRCKCGSPSYVQRILTVTTLHLTVNSSSSSSRRSSSSSSGR